MIVICGVRGETNSINAFCNFPLNIKYILRAEYLNKLVIKLELYHSHSWSMLTH